MHEAGTVASAPSPARVNDLFTGRRGPVTLTELVGLSVVLECTLVDLLLPKDDWRWVFAHQLLGLSVEALEDAQTATTQEYAAIVTRGAMARQHPSVVLVGRHGEARLRMWQRAHGDQSDEAHASFDRTWIAIEEATQLVLGAIEAGELSDPIEAMPGMVPRLEDGSDLIAPPSKTTRLFMSREWRERVQEQWLAIDPDWEGDAP